MTRPCCSPNTFRSRSLLLQSPRNRHRIRAHAEQWNQEHLVSSFETIEQALSKRAIDCWDAHKRERILIGIAGVPGSGKTTTTAGVCTRINNTLGTNVAVVVPMDGFHLFRSELDAMDDPAHAHSRRGAPFTFDAPKFVECVEAIRGGRADVVVPSFDHGIGDPIEGDVRVLATHRIVLVEGIYVLLDSEPWSKLRQLFDDTWFLDLEVDIAMENVRIRQRGIGLTTHDIESRIAANDKLNASVVAQTRQHAKLVVDLGCAHVQALQVSDS